MDYVNRYENRTLWSSGHDIVGKWGAVKVIMRARPAGECGQCRIALLLSSEDETQAIHLFFPLHGDVSALAE